MENSDVSSNLTGSTLSFNTKGLIGGLRSMRAKRLESRILVAPLAKSLPPLMSSNGLSLTHQIPVSSQASVLSIFPNPLVNRQNSNSTSDLLRWYPWWLEEQLKQVPSSILSKVVGHELLPRSIWTSELGRIFCEVAAFMISSQHPSVDDIVQHILAKGLMEEGTVKDGNLEARSLVFAMIGWQTMLYRPALGTCPPQQFAIIDEQDGYRGQAFMALKQCQGSAKRPLHDFLLGFGILLPPSNLCMSTSVEIKTSFSELKTVEPSNFNAFLLSSIGHFKIEWVDVLSCHLEVDERAKTIFFFRYPSFCIACSHCEMTEKTPKTIIHAAASPATSSRQWACEGDVTQMLQETLLSYRLLFGQDKQSRKMFRKFDPFACIPSEGRDHFLSSLCGQRSFKSPQLASDQISYDLNRQFPVLRSRIANLHRLLSASQPRGWKELWRDKRDSAGWYTFWIVLIFGGVALVLSTLQVILQIVQLSINR